MSTSTDTKSDLQLVFTKQETPPSCAELADFLHLFSRLYEASMDSFTGRNKDPNDDIEALRLLTLDLDSLRHEIVERLANVPMFIDPWRTTGQIGSDPDLALECKRVSLSSPLEICLYGFSTGLAIAVVLAGGEFKLFGLSVKINCSLGKALQDLVKLFALAKARKESKVRSRSKSAKGEHGDA